MPSECLLIINGRSLEAMQIAHTYAKERKFPAERIVVLTPPLSFFRNENFSPRWTVGRKEAEEVLLEPVLQRIEELNDPSPPALILSPDWPTRVKVPGSPEVSSTSFLSCAGDLPAAELIKNGRAASPWFSPPPDTPQKRIQLFHYPVSRKVHPPFYPAAMLGVFYPPMTPEKINKQLLTAVKADFDSPIGSIVFETNADVRTRTRLAQYRMAESRLREEGFQVEMLSATDPLPKKIIGVMSGAATINTGRYRGKLQPGSYADHLTSHAATFDLRIQTKLTEWLDAGAAASTGTVTEPYSIWTKFTEAAVFERYFRGTTLLEALMQSTASPFQVLIVGDPLCRPWASEMKELAFETEWEENYLRLDVTGAPKSSITELHLFVDGKRMEGKGPVWQIPFDAETMGPEVELDLHARYLWVPPQIGSLQKRLSTPVPSSLKLSGSVKSDHVVLQLKNKPQLVLAEVYRGLTKIYTWSPSSNKSKVTLGLDQSGTGPISLRVKGLTEAGEIRWSNYLDLDPVPPRASTP